MPSPEQSCCQIDTPNTNGNFGHQQQTAQASQALVEAADWLVTLNSDELSQQQQIEFQQWLQRQENSQAYNELTQTWQQFDIAQPKAAQQTLNYVLASKPSITTNTATKKAPWLVVSAVSAFALVLFAQSPNGRFISADYATLTKHAQSITLADSSKIFLPPRSAVNINYTKQARHIELIKGQVFIEVAKDNSRPLTISSQHGSAQALGTAFSVEIKDKLTQVKVTESTVKVCPAVTENSIQGSCKNLIQGQQVQVTSAHVNAIKTSTTNLVIDWQQQTISADNQPLLAVIEKLQQHYPGYIQVNHTALQDLTISGVFSLQNTLESLQLISSILPVSVEQYAGFVLVVNKNKQN